MAFQPIRCQTNQYSHLFFLSMIKIWNILPDDFIQSPGMHSFKRKVNNYLLIGNLLYIVVFLISVCSPPGLLKFISCWIIHGWAHLSSEVYRGKLQPDQTKFLTLKVTLRATWIWKWIKNLKVAKFDT